MEGWDAERFVKDVERWLSAEKRLLILSGSSCLWRLLRWTRRAPAGAASSLELSPKIFGGLSHPRRSDSWILSRGVPA